MKKKHSLMGCVRVVFSKLVSAFQPISQFNRIFWTQAAKCYSHGSSNHYRFAVHVSDQGFVLFQYAGRMWDGYTGYGHDFEL